MSSLPKPVVVVGPEATSSLWQFVFHPRATDLELMQRVLALNPTAIANTPVNIYYTNGNGPLQPYPGTTNPQGYREPPLHAAVKSKNLPLVKLLCGPGTGPGTGPTYANLDALDGRGSTALRAAMQVSMQGEKLSQTGFDIAWYLLGRGADKNAGTPSAWKYAGDHAEQDEKISALYEWMQPYYRGSNGRPGPGEAAMGP